MGVTMIWKKRIGVALALAAIAAPAAAQVKRAGSVVNSPAVAEITMPDGTYITPPVTVDVDSAGVPIGPDNPRPVAIVSNKQAVMLITASATTGPQTLFGGRYVFSQSCLNYNGQGLSLRYRGPDGTAMLTAATKTSADAALVEVPAGAIVDATVPSAAIGCNASLSRIPQ